MGRLVRLLPCRSGPSVDTSLSQMELKERDAAAELEPGLALGWEKRPTGCVVWGKGFTVRLVWDPGGWCPLGQALGQEGPGMLGDLLMHSRSSPGGCLDGG